MFPIALRPSKSDRSLRKLKKGRNNLSWSSKSNKVHLARPEVDFAAFHSGLPREDDHAPLQSVTSLRRPRRISTRNMNRDTILIDLTNNDLLPALDYAFAILEADAASTRSLPPPPPPKTPTLSKGSSSNSSDMPCTPSSSVFSTTSFSTSMRSAPPRYVYVSSPLNDASIPSFPSARPSSQKHGVTPSVPSRDDEFDPHELSRALAYAQSSSPVDFPSSAELPTLPCVPFPPPAAPSVARVPLLQRKPRLLHSTESSIDGHECFVSRSCPGSSKVSLARSASSLDHHRDVFGSGGACPSSTSVNTIDSNLSVLLARHPSSHTPSSSLKLFSSPKKTRPIPARRASTPPPSRSRLGIPSAQPPVPALPDVFLLGPAARREAVSDSNSFISRSRG